MPPTLTSNDFRLAEQASAEGRIKDAVELYVHYVNQSVNAPEALKLKEEAVIRAGQLLSQDQEALAAMIRTLEPAWLVFPRAKTVKIIRHLLDLFPANSAVLLRLLEELVDWCTRDRRFYLKQALQIKLAGVQFAGHKYTQALQLLDVLSKELRRLDDKLSLVEVHLLESQILFGIKAMAKARAALTAARSAANAVYCPTLLMAQLDLQSGLLHCEDEDYGTATSHLIESIDGFNLEGSKLGNLALRYILVCKVMLGQEFGSILNGKSAKPLLDECKPWIEALEAIRAAFKEKSLHDFDEALKQHNALISSDKIVAQHLNGLYDTLLEKNMLKLTAPFSVIPIQSLAEQLQLSTQTIESKLCQMILDNKLDAVIDQNGDANGGCLIKLEPSEEDPVYTAAIATIRNLDGVVDTLYAKAKST